MKLAAAGLAERMSTENKKARDMSGIIELIHTVVALHDSKVS